MPYISPSKVTGFSARYRWKRHHSMKRPSWKHIMRLNAKTNRAIVLARGELGELDSTHSSVSIGTTHNVQQLVTCQQGDSKETREGDQIQVSSIFLKYYVEPNTTTPTRS